MKGFLVFIIGYYVGKNFALLDIYTPAGLDTGFEQDVRLLQTAETITELVL